MLVAFQQVEDQLSALDALASEAGSQQRATDAADLSLRLTTNRFNAGAVSYLDVVTAQTIALTNRRTADQIDARQIEAEVGLLKALGGGWQAGTSVEHLIRNIDEFVLARVRRCRGKSTEHRQAVGAMLLSRVAFPIAPLMNPIWHCKRLNAHQQNLRAYITHFLA
ncbi:hypothetical protein NL30_31465 [Burkholderia contaminans]|nr:hypothetical protein NL30_31465 [Burkholderia contaminans]